MQIFIVAVENWGKIRAFRVGDAMEPKPAQTQTLYPGMVTTKYGLYTVTHDMPHSPKIEKFFDRGVSLPTCQIPGCQVTFELVRLVSWLDEAFGESAPAAQKCIASIAASASVFLSGS